MNSNALTINDLWLQIHITYKFEPLAKFSSERTNLLFVSDSFGQQICVEKQRFECRQNKNHFHENGFSGNNNY